MTPFAVIFTLLTGYFLLKLPRAWAPLPLLLGATYMTLGQGLEIGPLHFYVIRILVTLGMLRVVSRGERIVGGWQPLDRMMGLWAICAVCSSCFHKDFTAALIGRLGLVFDTLGLYFLLRVFIQDVASVQALSRIVVIVLVPIALEMLLETVTGRNEFAFLGGVPDESEIRGGKVRAQGPFAHSILAGTVGGVCLPLALMFWKRHRRVALIGLAASTAMILASRSSGPIMTAFMGCLGLCLWPVRNHMRLIRWGALAGLVALNFAMNAPVYYLVARIDFTGSSTSHYRAALIESALYHINEWWLGGTDYTRHWMPTGAAWSEDQADITNYYIKMGVLGGLPLMLAFVGVLVSGFSMVGKALKRHENGPEETRFLLWTLGAVLFAHTGTMISVSYYDQSSIFLFLVLSSIASVQTTSEAPAVLDAGIVEAPLGSAENLYHRC